MLQPLLLLLFVSASRTLGSNWLAKRMNASAARKLLIYGAGNAGAQTAAALAGSQLYRLLGFIDDDPAKIGRTINGARVVSRAEAPSVIAIFSATDILLALPSAGRERRNQIIGELQHLPVRIRSLPSLTDLASGRMTVEDFKDLDAEDLLGRDPVPAQPELLAAILAKKTVLVTGAGGSIGSELCRQIVREQPTRLLLVDHSEFALYGIHQELELLTRRSGSTVELVPLLANVCDLLRMSAIFDAYRPSVVYHAAAYKHVPLVESNPGAGIINNVLGTLNMANAAWEAEVKHFVLVSTDKAVRPTNVMGASKRIAEQVLQSLADCTSNPFATKQAPAGASLRRPCFSMVRFGNVLGSSGSVVPLFRAQIGEGGPLTVTHPDVTRYFMTIPEAAQLVLHAAAMAQDGDLYVLDMGAPVKILDLAKRMVALSGLTVRDAARPEGDIEIRFTGLRPGEKLYEELLIGDHPMSTSHPRVVRAREDFMPWAALDAHLHNLFEAIRCGNASSMKRTLQLLVPGYAPAPYAKTHADQEGTMNGVEQGAVHENQ